MRKSLSRLSFLLLNNTFVSLLAPNFPDGELEFTILVFCFCFFLFFFAGDCESKRRRCCSHIGICRTRRNPFALVYGKVIRGKSDRKSDSRERKWLEVCSSLYAPKVEAFESTKGKRLSIRLLLCVVYLLIRSSYVQISVHSVYFCDCDAVSVTAHRTARAALDQLHTQRRFPQ